MRKACWITLALSLLAGRVSAGGFYFGAHGGYTTGGDVENEEFGYGAQVGISVLDTFYIELSGTLVEDETANPDVEYDVGNFALTGMFGFELFDLVTPYIGGGVNYNRFSFDTHSVWDLEDTDSVGFHVCGGVNAHLVDWCSVFIEYRYHFLTDTLNDFASDELDLDLRDDDSHLTFGMVRVGVNFMPW